MQYFVGINADSVWQKAFSFIKNIENVHLCDSRTGKTSEVINAFFTIENPRERWIYSRAPVLNIAFAFAEIIWIMNGCRDSRIINFWNNALIKFAGPDEKYYGAYGFRLRNQFGFDQLNKAYETLSRNPDSRQVVLQIWDPKSDFPNEDGSPRSMDIPCNISSLLKVRNNKLVWTQVLRSNDIFLGIPYNFIQFTAMQEIMAGWLNLDMGSYNHLSNSLHLYKKDEAKIKIIKDVVIEENMDSLMLPKKESDFVFKYLFKKMIRMISCESEKELLAISEFEHSSIAYKNITSVLCAEAARRKNWKQLSDDMIYKCSNPLYCKLWQLWVKRFNLD